MQFHRLALIAPAFAVVVLALAPGPVAASCAMLPPVEVAIDKADAVFVGTVAGLRHEARWATVQVEEIWKGPALPAVVEVRGGLDPTAFSSIDRTYNVGQRYLFVVSLRVEGAVAALQDDACTATSEWTEALTDLRPGTVRTPAAENDAEDGDGLPLASIAVAAIVVLALGVLAFGAVALRRS
jgi:hypothetical protein